MSMLAVLMIVFSRMTSVEVCPLSQKSSDCGVVHGRLVQRFLLQAICIASAIIQSVQTSLRERITLGLLSTSVNTSISPGRDRLMIPRIYRLWIMNLLSSDINKDSFIKSH